jgi:hypothetical protein
VPLVRGDMEVNQRDKYGKGQRCQDPQRQKTLCLERLEKKTLKRQSLNVCYPSQGNLNDNWQHKEE